MSGWGPYATLHMTVIQMQRLICSIVLSAAIPVWASFFSFRRHDSTFLEDLGTIDTYLFPLSLDIPPPVRQATNSSSPFLAAYAISIIDAAMYFRTHPELLDALTARVIQRGRGDMVKAEREAFDALVQLTGPSSQVGKLMNDYKLAVTGDSSFSEYVKDSLAIELKRQLSQETFKQAYDASIVEIELAYERRIMDVMLKGTAGVRELQAPFLMMASAMKLVHEHVGPRRGNGTFSAEGYMTGTNADGTPITNNGMPVGV